MEAVIIVVLPWLILVSALVLAVKYLSECGGSVEITLPSIKIKWGRK